ncbi:hypothetical protein ZIOFF_011180 [Zingiber officinale]|uniref:Uncharacterized protein n=1 Tax=Zingiber officinale TaxID=94328 RepID=A0A8J5HK88_ZINOF|nr:hypothetical protein ZIOFF_011180 [Zingiber officinale]
MHWLIAMARRRWLWWLRKGRAQVFDEAAVAIDTATVVTAPRPWWSVKAVFAAAAAWLNCLVKAEDMEAGSGGRLSGAEIGDLVLREAMHFTLYL